VSAVAGRIGPNAITRVAEALRAAGGEALARREFGAAGLSVYLAAPPSAMVDEEEVVRLHRALRADLGPGSVAIARAAGVATADYLLAHRIPRAFQALLRVLPRRLAGRVLLAAIARHAWTFTGSGRFRVVRGAALGFEITDSPLSRVARESAPACDYYAATFERLFRKLVAPRATVVETECQATGAPACRFLIGW
jgi:divinyl protochlorophyllide a 8-vinyl-reductase